MNILYYDCFAGLSGDMNLAAMIDLGVDPDMLRSELEKLGLSDEYELEVTQGARNGIHGTRVDVHLSQTAHNHDHAHGHHKQGHDEHEHTHDHKHDHHHTHAHSHEPSGHTHGPHRNFADIRSIIEQSALTDEVKETSIRIFKKVAEAEAKVHGKGVDEVHFHEVGATDSIVDIVGAAICYHALGVDAVWASPVELGSGFVRCAHGVIPVPAPATSAILHDIPTTRGNTDIEATTPTGAAILATLVDTFSESPDMVVTQTGYGVGHKDTEFPNLARVYLAQVEPAKSKSRKAELLQCNIDDMTGEQLGDVMDLLFENGAMDVHFTAIVMKKGRPATQLALLCGTEDEPRFKELLFRNTTTLGIKSISIDKTELERRFRKVETEYGPVTIKEAILGGETLRAKPEYDECREISRRTGVPLATVQAAALNQE